MIGIHARISTIYRICYTIQILNKFEIDILRNYKMYQMCQHSDTKKLEIFFSFSSDVDIVIVNR